MFSREQIGYGVSIGFHNILRLCKLMEHLLCRRILYREHYFQGVYNVRPLGTELQNN